MGGRKVVDLQALRLTRFDEEDIDVNHGQTKQWIAAFIISIASLNSGFTSGWIVPMRPTLVSAESPVGPMLPTDIDCLVSAAHYFSLVTAVFTGIAANFYGRKPALYLTSVFGVLSGFILTGASTSTALYVGKVFSTFSVLSGLIVAPMFISEIAHPAIRGTLMTLNLLMLNAGTLLAVILGRYLDYKSFNIIYIALPALLILLLLFIKESPYFLIFKTRLLEAEGSLFYYRGDNRAVAKTELKIMITFSQCKPTKKFRQIFCAKATKNSIIISLGLVILQCLTGFEVLHNYSRLIFENLTNPIASYSSIIVVIATQTLSSLVILPIMDYFGRKTLLFMSYGGNALTLLCFSGYLMAKTYGADVTNINWLPLVCLCCFIVSNSMGVASLTSIISIEVSPVEIKGILIALLSILTSFLTLGLDQSYPLLHELMYDHINFLIPAAINVLGLLFTWMVVPETKGKTLLEISDALNEK